MKNDAYVKIGLNQWVGSFVSSGMDHWTPFN